MRPSVLLLMSGGLDSTACLNYYLDRGQCVQGLFVDYGQPAASLEAEAAAEIASHYAVPLTSATVDHPHAMHAGMIYGRNLMLLAIARLRAGSDPLVLGIGIRTESPYADCSPHFIGALQNVLDIEGEGSVTIDAPLLHFDKCDVLRYLLTQHVPLHLTYSCERGVPRGCNRCKSCREVQRAYDACK